METQETQEIQEKQIQEFNWHIDVNKSIAALLLNVNTLVIKMDVVLEQLSKLYNHSERIAILEQKTKELDVLPCLNHTEQIVALNTNKKVFYWFLGYFITFNITIIGWFVMWLLKK